MKQKNVLILSDIIEGGEWIATVRLLNALKKKGGYKFNLIGFKCNYKPHATPFDEIVFLKRAKADKPLSFIKKLYKDFLNAKKHVLPTLKSNRFDFVLCTDYLLAIALKSANFNTKIVYSFHGIKSEIGNNDYRQLITRMLEKFSLIMSDSIIVPSIHAKEFILKQTWPISKKIYVVPNIIPNEFFRKITRVEKVKFRRKYNLKSDEKIILYSGRIAKFKGLENLVKGFSKFDNKKYKAKLIFAYPKSSTNQDTLALMIRIISANRLEKYVKFISDLNQSELIKLYSVTNLLVLPSEIEMAPLSIVEGFAQGLPTIASDVGNVKELLSKVDSKLILKNNSPQEINKNLKWFFELHKKQITKLKNRSVAVAKNYREDKVFTTFKNKLDSDIYLSDR